MNYSFNEDGRCLVVDLREVDADDLYRYEMALDRYPFLEQESYEDNLYHVYLKTEGDWEDIKSLTIELDDIMEDIEVSELERETDENCR